MKDNQTNTKGSTLNQEDLRYFTGSETWYRHSLFSKFLYTDGVQYVAEHGQAYWLIDKIFASHSCVDKIAKEDFCLWELKLNKDGQGATLTCTDGNMIIVYSENILFTDFPLQSIKFYCTNNVLMLPSEY